MICNLGTRNIVKVLLSQQIWENGYQPQNRFHHKFSSNFDYKLEQNPSDYLNQCVIFYFMNGYNIKSHNFFEILNSVPLVSFTHSKGPVFVTLI